MTALRQRLASELRDNILPFWMDHTLDEEHGGFYGALTNDLVVHNEAPRSAVLTARILWTYSTAYRLVQDARYLAMARRAYDTLTRKFWDHTYGGVYWSIDREGRPLSDRKHVYAQAFAIYGLAEFQRATGERESLQLAQDLFERIEQHTFDPRYGGNLEGGNRQWGPADDMRFGPQDPDACKSMNTLLHLLEAYTELLRVWPDETLQAKQRGLLEVFLQHIIDPETDHFKLFFDEAWHSLNDHISPGHDIEGSWLLWEAAEVQGDAALLMRTRSASVRMAEAVQRDGLARDGLVLHELTPRGVVDDEQHWWPQAEGMVGFYNAYQLSGRAAFAQAAERLWQLIETRFIDRAQGDWFKVLDGQGRPLPQVFKVGPWECPYHHSRACFEMLARIPA